MARKKKTSHSPAQGVLAGFEAPAAPPEPAPAPPETAPAAPLEVGAPGSLRGQKVYVVDAHSLIYQVFHAMPDMSSPTGQPVGAVHGFIRDMLDLIQHRKPDFLFCAFDAAGDTFRHEIFSDYKINREEMPEDLRPQIESIHRMLEALGIADLSLQSYEADDLLATLGRQVEELGGECFLVTSDKDCRQLITDRVKLFNIRKNRVFDQDELGKEWGIRPDQVVDFQALVGDKVDDVPGVPLIGPKLASQLLTKYNTLDNVLDHADDVSGVKRSENLKKYRDQALLSRQLVRLDDHVPIEIDWQAGRVGGVDRALALELCREFGFRRLGDRMADLAVESSPDTWSGDYERITSAEQLQQAAGRLSGAKRLSLFALLTDPRPRWGELAGLAFSAERGRGVFVPLGFEDGPDPTQLWPNLQELLQSDAEKVGDNMKGALVALRSAGVTLRHVVCDLQVADYLLAPGERTHELSDLSRRHLNHKLPPETELLGSGAARLQWRQLPLQQAAGFAAERADAALRVSSIMLDQLEQETGLAPLYRDLELPVLEVLAEMEFNGIRIDVPLLRCLSEQYGQRLEEMEEQIHALAGSKFNIDSPRQLATVLFEDLGLPVIKQTPKTGPSTDADVLAELAERHDLPARIIEYRQHAKLKSTYMDALPELVHPQTGRVHTSLKQDVAATGRLSSQEPNLQNIPIRTAEGRAIRAAFVPREEWTMLAADYSQIELRVLAHFCGDEALRRAFEEDRDIHTLVASEVYGVPADQVDSELRRRAKAINFGVIYGQTPFGLAKALGISKTEAGEFIDAYFDRYPGVDTFVNETLDACRRRGYVETILGRRRMVDGIRSAARRSGSRQRNMPERIAVNAVIQGSAADLIKRAMVRTHHRIQTERLQAKLLLQVHDELVLEAPPDEVASLAQLVKAEMSGAATLSVPLKVDVKAGPNWADAQPLP